MSLALVQPRLTAAGHPSILHAIDTGGVYLDPGQSVKMTFNPVSGEYDGAAQGVAWTITKSGGFWTLERDGSLEGTGPADSGTPLGTYTSGETYTVAAAAGVAGATTAEPTLSPGAPGVLIPEV